MHLTESASAAPPSGPVSATRWLAVGSVLALIVLGLVWELWLAPSRPPGLWAAKVFPLCLPLAGLLRLRLYTYRWVSLLVWPYFIEGVMRAWSNAGVSGTLALIEIALCLSLFFACIAHVQLRLGPRRKNG